MHVAIIMDGNGRWAQVRWRPRSAGHCAGATAVPRVVEELGRRQRRFGGLESVAGNAAVAS